MIPVKVDQLLLSNVGFVVLLSSDEEDRSLPIFIGASEAQAIAIQINGIDVPRPLTHDLLKNVLDFMECRLKRVDICKLSEGTFYAKLILEHDGRESEVDSRPSDAIALALRVGAPLFVAEEVMTQAGRVFHKDEEGRAQADGGEPLDVPDEDLRQEGASATDLLKKKLERAIAAERYEEAAGLRDEIKRLESTHTGN